jgi:hypothetical protein
MHLALHGEELLHGAEKRQVLRISLRDVEEFSDVPQNMDMAKLYLRGRKDTLERDFEGGCFVRDDESKWIADAFQYQK